jgi:hypothetical protein
MARKVFFSFHFERDAWRVGQVRNSNVVKNNYDQPPFYDWANWETVKSKGKEAIRKWIDDQLYGSSVTIVLIGQETYTREFVLYEIEKSYKENKGLFGIYINHIKNQNQQTDIAGRNPFEFVKDKDGHALSRLIPTYDWVYNDGRNQMGNWIEMAAKKLGR